jgi:hypothetical protein
VSHLLHEFMTGQTSVMASPSSRRATKRRRSSITELAFHGIHTSRLQKSEKCNPCARYEMSPMSRAAHHNLNLRPFPTLACVCTVSASHLPPSL